tara:strand:+ start:91 stop:342 length:252 start_codon:yes stop_codon:yes gene_type:complete
MNHNTNNTKKYLRGSLVGDSLNLDKYISKQLPFINVKKLNGAKRVRKMIKPQKIKRRGTKKQKKRKGAFVKKNNKSRKKRRKM